MKRLHCSSMASFAAIVLALCGSASAQLMVDEEGELEENELVQGDTVVRLVKYRNQLFRRIEVSDLEGLTVGDTPLHGLMICIEGKFSKFTPPNVFNLIGSNSPLAISPKDKVLVTGLMRGDNIWIAGTAQKMKSGASCYAIIKAVKRLGNDMDLYRKRFDLYKASGKWERLIELGRWIEKSGEQLANARFEDSNKYRVLKDKACRQALQIHAEEIAPDDVDEHTELARMYVDLLGRPGRLSAVEHLLKAVMLDPTHGAATDMLTEYGYVKYKGSWITEVERQDRVREERARAQALAADTQQVKQPDGTTTADTTPTEETRPTMGLKQRLRMIQELEERMRSDLNVYGSIADSIAKEEDAIACTVVWIYANTGGTVGLDGLLKGLNSKSEVVRKDIADALAGSGELADLSDVIRTDRSDGVRAYAVSAMASVGTKDSTDRLVGILVSVNDTTRKAVVNELVALTGQKLESNADWRAWWQGHEGSFKGPRER
jgi:hypothetical protein